MCSLTDRTCSDKYLPFLPIEHDDFQAHGPPTKPFWAMTRSSPSTTKIPGKPRASISAPVSARQRFLKVIIPRGRQEAIIMDNINCTLFVSRVPGPLTPQNKAARNWRTNTAKRRSSQKTCGPPRVEVVVSYHYVHALQNRLPAGDIASNHTRVIDETKRSCTTTQTQLRAGSEPGKRRHQ